jgi:outer membrane lipoprotein SlyB
MRGLVFVVALACLLPLAAACATKRPVLYPNAHYAAVGAPVAANDIARCQERAAEQGYDARPGARAVGGSAVGAAGGAAVGAVGGAIVGSAGRGAAVGAGVGGTRGLLRGLFHAREPAPLQKGFIEACLDEQGYRVIGWR